MPDAKPEGAPDEESEEALSEDALDLDGLVQRGDVAGLLALARAYRSGKAPGGRDMKKCFDAYVAAASLGSADAEFAAALFCMTGSVVAQDLKEGATRLRAAAEKGSVPAKVYLGNLYELGIHYKADPEKADVWYRNAARSAQVDAEPGTGEHARAMAELGCARYVLALVESGAVEEEDKARLLQRARSHGYGLRVREGVLGEGERPTFTEALVDVEGAAAPRGERARASTTPDTKTAKERAAQREGDQGAAEKRTAKEPKPAKLGPSQAVLGLSAFGYALLFVAAGVGAAYAAMLGALELVQRGTMLPGLGERAELVFPIVLAVVGVLPAWLVYRLSAVAKAIASAAMLGGVGWVAWGTGTGRIHADPRVQALAFGLAGFLAALFVLGLLGGTKKQPPGKLPRRAG